VTLKTRFPAIVSESERKVRKAIRKAEASIERRAKKRSRVDTGNMRGGWQHRATGNFEGAVFNLVHYTIHHEYGTSKMAAQPMLRPAVEETRPELIAEIRLAYR
jgi:HK97 gp10 family phage protein